MYPKLIDNNREYMKDIVKEILSSGEFKHLSIATGYWDLPGMVDIIDDLAIFENIRLLIGQEPLPARLQKNYSAINDNTTDGIFPDSNFIFDLEEISKTSEAKQMREIAKKLLDLIQQGVLEVKIFRHPRLHAKAYIFGNMESSSAVGIIGSSNFTEAGLTRNAELNYLEQDHKQVLYQPKNSKQDHGHLSWFNELWNDPEAIDWTGDFTDILEKSPVGDMTYGPYDVYIKTLMEVFPDELLPAQELSKDTNDVLYSFQNRNAGILLNKLQRMGVAMLSDSVGLGKTVTAGAVIKHYREMGAKRILVIAPASLKQQWVDDLGERFGLTDNDFGIISMQDIGEQTRLIEEMNKPWIREVDLFVIDEAHNLRNPGSARYESILNLLDTSPNAPVLLLTATPVNNSLMDFANQIQLGLHGSMISVPVQIKNNKNEIETIDFIEALCRIQSEARKAEKAGKQFDWDRYSSTLRSGLRHYLVRSTRQGVEKEGGLLKGGVQQHFPKTKVQQLSYRYDQRIINSTHEICENAIRDVFDGIDPLRLNLDVACEVTQQTMHPIDLYGPTFRGEVAAEALDSLNDEQISILFNAERSSTLIPSVFQLVNFLGFVPYRTDLYKHRYYGKTKHKIREIGLSAEERKRINVQRTIHNIMHVTWLKRLESSASTLLKSVDYYNKRLDLFEKYLEKGYVVTLPDIMELESEYGEDIDRAFSDYEKTFNAIQKALDSNKDPAGLELKGVERKEATEQVYKIGQMRTDIARDKKIISVLRRVLTDVQDPQKNGKLHAFAQEIKNQLNRGKHGGKVLVFSFFSDTIEYLKESLPALMRDVPDFDKRSEYLTGSSGTKTEDVTRRFAPIAKKHMIKDDEQELDFLFATDVLSEGQNLQDAGLLINFDLHWNPVRMIQRNGRINRLGSSFNNVLIINMKPHEDLELYLNLVKRLERKIDAIKNSIGTDQSVLGEEENPIEFVDFFSDDVAKASKAAAALSESSQALDVFDSSDEYIFELRKFITEHRNDETARRINAIPAGKWNYLPERKTELLHESPKEQEYTILPSDSYIVLERIKGVGAVSNEPFETTLFVKVQAIGRYSASVMEEVEALSLIRTTPEDNRPIHDAIPKSVDRTLVARRSEKMAKVRTESNDGQRDIKPSELKALTVMQAYHKNAHDFVGLAKKGIRREPDNREFKKIVKCINTDIKDRGVVTSTTQTRFITLMNKLADCVQEEQRADEIDSILFYAARR